MQTYPQMLTTVILITCDTVVGRKLCVWTVLFGSLFQRFKTVDTFTNHYTNAQENCLDQCPTCFNNDNVTDD